MPCAQQGEGGRVQFDEPSGVFRFAAGDLAFVADGHEASVDGDGASFPVDIGPLQPEDFVAAHPGRGGQVERWIQPMPGCSLQELLQLVLGPASPQPDHRSHAPRDTDRVDPSVLNVSASVGIQVNTSPIRDISRRGEVSRIPHKNQKISVTVSHSFE